MPPARPVCGGRGGQRARSRSLLARRGRRPRRRDDRAPLRMGPRARGRGVGRSTGSRSALRHPLCQRLGVGHVQQSSHTANRQEWAARRHALGNPLRDGRGSRGRSRTIRYILRREGPPRHWRRSLKVCVVMPRSLGREGVTSAGRHHADQAASTYRTWRAAPTPTVKSSCANCVAVNNLPRSPLEGYSPW